MKRLAVLLAGAIMLVAVGFAAQPASAAPAAPAKVTVQHIAFANTYTYTKTLQCVFRGIANYTPVRLVIEHAGTWKHVYRVQFGNIIAPNSEYIRWVYVRQAQPNGTWMGNGYSQAFVNQQGGATQALGSGYTPWIPSTQKGNAFVQLENVNNDVCGKWFPTAGTDANAGGNW
jgi:hypothetical protein